MNKMKSKKKPAPVSMPIKGELTFSQKMMIEARRKNLKIIQKYMSGRDIPKWFRGISYFQNKAANRLNESLLYDLEQQTTFRVHEILLVLGFNPMISNKQIKFLIKMSRGSDLAFLWFLYELHYKTKGKEYSINEQLIFSLIAHLDMVTTLRELDRILPPAPIEEPPPPRRPRKTEVVIPGEVHIHGPLEHVESPYLQPMRLPKPYGNPNTAKRQSVRVTLGEYEVWADPNYVVHNEANRWFAQYEPKPCRRIVHHILNEEIDRIIEDPQETRERAKNPKVLCEGHRRIAEMEEHLKRELQVIAREQCLKYFDYDYNKKEHAKSRVKAQMEKDMEYFLGQFRDSLSRVNPCTCEDREDRKSIVVICQPDSAKFDKRSSDSLGEYEEEDGSWDDSRRSTRISGGQNPSYSEEDSEDSGCDRSCQEASNSRNDSNRRSTTSNRRSTASKQIDAACKEEYVSEELSLHSSNMFFAAAKEHQPLRFDYHKIFLVNHPYFPKPDVREQAAKAINSEMSFQSKVECMKRADVRKQVDRYVKRTWMRSVKRYNQEHPNCRELAEMRAEAEREKVPLDFGRSTFDPKDKKLMSHMLQTAFEYMKKNPKFVLASLPDACKLPTFVYFIENRYGLRYNEEERQKLYRESMRILRALEKLTAAIPMPKIKQYCENPFVSYSCHKYIRAKAEHIKKLYYEKLDNAIMRQARVFWFAMRPYLCTSGPPRNTYYAYMPSRIVDITRFKQWKSAEFMDAWGAWMKRQRAIRNQPFK